MFVYHKDLNGRHLATEFFRQGEAQKRHRMVDEEARVGTETVITAYWTPLVPVASFNYLGRFLSVTDNDWEVVVRNLRR